ncbi:anthranilate synthase component I [Pikeienuella sp. HZG-20]|uniref:anthranilate synthase component I n=1 Tax=Paludibacillus litoralis TaxID=3133267 RepID=UPI0030ECE3F7
MEISPSFESFAARHESGVNQVLWTQLPADLDTPVSLMLKLTAAAENSFLLESVTGGEVKGRYSALGMKPDVIWRCVGDKAEINRAARYDPDAFTPEPLAPLDSLRAFQAESRIDLPSELPPIAAGLFGFFGYDMARLAERLPAPNPDPLGLPDSLMLRPTVVAVMDAVKDVVTLIAPVWARDGLAARAAYAQAAERLSDAVAALDRPAPLERDFGAATAIGEPISNTGVDDYLAMVAKGKAYIEAGDIFQVVLSQRWRMDFPLPPFSFYRALRRTNPSPYMFFFNFGGFQLAGASPEVLVKVRGGVVTIRPIAGTRRRGATEAEDRALEAELMSDPKELAEHLMLLDLGRNDVGRVSKIGTVAPTAEFTVERYSHVMHIVSNVEGELAPGQDALSALLAGLPAGTVSGAPKIRAMEIIDELEREKRGPYAGGVGHISCADEMDMCIALRTAVIKDGALYVQAGGGVVWDSDPELERQETMHKARAVMRAAEEAARFAQRGNR